jgi:hypothetical protein
VLDGQAVAAGEAGGMGVTVAVGLLLAVGGCAVAVAGTGVAACICAAARWGGGVDAVPQAVRRTATNPRANAHLRALPP